MNVVFCWTNDILNQIWESYSFGWVSPKVKHFQEIIGSRYIMCYGPVDNDINNNKYHGPLCNNKLNCKFIMLYIYTEFHVDISHNMHSITLLPHIWITDECRSRRTNDCDQICRDTDASYTCSCRSGYRLASNRRSCNGKSLFSYNHVYFYNYNDVG